MKPAILCLGSLATACYWLSIASLPIQAQSTLQWLPNITGRYEGQISTGTQSVSGTTEFFLSQTGSLLGTYSVRQDNKLDLGVLHDCNATGPLKIRCIWSDRFGSGDLNLLFTSDLSRFNGQWRVLGSPETYAWAGSRSSLIQNVEPQNQNTIPLNRNTLPDNQDLEPLF